MKARVKPIHFVSVFCFMGVAVIFFNGVNMPGAVTNRTIRPSTVPRSKSGGSSIRGIIKEPIAAAHDASAIVALDAPAAAALDAPTVGEGHLLTDTAHNGTAASEQSHGNTTTWIQDLRCAQGEVACRKTQRMLQREQESFSLTDVYPHGGGTLPNYFLRGIDRGLSAVDYRGGIIGFLHHNKASGTSVKMCMKKMVANGSLRGRPTLVVSTKQLTVLAIGDMMENDVLMGDHIFGFCEHSGGRNCSYFTFLRDPYERVLSAYFYCKAYNDQLCGPVPVKSLSIQQFAVYQGSFLFYQVLMDQRYCEKRDKNLIDGLMEFGLKDSKFVPRGMESKLVPYKLVCWFRQRVYLEALVSEGEREILLSNILNNLEDWFSLIGLKEEYDFSLDMLSTVYGLPFSKQCRGKVTNPSSPHDPNKNSERQRLKSKLMTSPEVVRALRFDLRIYERAQKLFERQRRRFKALSREKV